MTFRVLHGFQASAGQPAMMARALREIGIDASNVVIGNNKFSYPADYSFPDATMATKRRVLAELGSSADVVHIHAITPFYNRGMPQFPMGTDLLALKAAGKRVVFHFRGSEIRLASLFAAATPYHYVEDDPERLMAKFPEAAQQAYIAMCRALADEIVVSDPELMTYVPEAKTIPRVIDFNAWKRVGIEGTGRPLVVHAPSRRGVKGTRHVLAAVEALKNEGLDFDFRLVENLSQDEARAVFEQSDIIVDQLRIGWYGVLAVEGMALGKAVVSYVRDDLLSHLGAEPPIMVANPDTISEALRELIQSQNLRETVAERGYEYCRHVHDPLVVARQCREIYESALARPQQIDLSAYMALNEKQELLQSKRLKKARASAYAEMVKEASTQSYWRDVYHLYDELGPVKFLQRAAGKLIK